MLVKAIFRSTLLVQASDWNPCLRGQPWSTPRPLPPSSSPCPAWSTPASNRSLTSSLGLGRRWWRRPRMTTCHSWTRSPAASQLPRPPSVRASLTSPAEEELHRDARGAFWKAIIPRRRFNPRRLPRTPLVPFPSPPAAPFLLTSPSPPQSHQRPLN